MQQGRGFMAGAPLFLALQTGGCTDIGQLQPGVLYEFKVTTFSQLWSTGEAATVRARPL